MDDGCTTRVVGRGDQLRIFFDSRLAVRGLGISTATRRLVHCLERDSRLSLRVNATPYGWTPLGKADTIRRTGLVDLSPRLDPRTRRADVTHYFGNTSPQFPDSRTVITVHDLMSLRSVTSKGRAFRHLLVDGLRRGRGASIVAISGQTAAEIASFLSIDLKRVHVIPHGRRDGLRGAGERPHILMLGGANDPRKRFGLGVAAYLRYVELAGSSALPLVVAGRAGVSDSELGRVPSGLIRVDRDPDEQTLAAYMGSAACLIYPTREEGFGLPIVEAGEVGTAVVLDGEADIPSEPMGRHVFRVLGGVDTVQWARQILRAVSATPVPDALVQLPTWDGVADMYAAVYAEAAQ